MPKTDFIPSKHGFHFANSFINNVINSPVLGHYETYGRCGGMAYAALDYYFAKIPIPTHKTDDFPKEGVPSDGSKLAGYIYHRLIDSFMTLSALKFVSWTMASDHKNWFRKGVTYWTKTEEFPKLCRQIDQGIPVVLGLVGASNLLDVGNKNHQVVAYGYDYDTCTEKMTVYIYDNNSPDEEVVLTSDKTNPHFNATNRVDAWRGFFVQDYAPEVPIYQDLLLISGISINPVPVQLHGPLECKYIVKNTGEYPAHVNFLYLYLRGPNDENLDYFLGSDHNSMSILPNEERLVVKSCDNFGTIPGQYLVGACYQSEQGNWHDIPALSGSSEMSKNQVLFPVIPATLQEHRTN